MIAIFYSFNVFGTAIDGYPKIVLIISAQTFFFNKKIAYSLSMSAFTAKALNSIMKSAMFCFPCLNVSIFYLASAAFVLLLNIVFISFTKFFQSCVSISLSRSSSFCYAYIPAIPPLRYVRITIILLLVFITLLLLKDNLISLYQSSNFILFLSNYFKSRTILFGIVACMFLFVCAGAINISLLVCLFVPSEASFIIFNNSSCSNNTSILFIL